MYKNKGVFNMKERWSNFKHYLFLYSIIGLGAIWFLFIMTWWVLFLIFGGGDPESDLRLFPGM